MVEMGVQQREEVGAGGGGGYATRVVAIIIETDIGLTYLPDFTKHEGHGVYVFENDAGGKAHVAEHRRMKYLVTSIGVFMAVVFNPIARGVLADIGNEIQERLFFRTIEAQYGKLYHVVALAQLLHDAGIGVGGQEVVGVDKGDPLACRQTDASVACFAQPFVFLMNHAKTLMAGTPFVAEMAAAVG